MDVGRSLSGSICKALAKGFAAISIIFGIWILIPNGQNDTALNADGLRVLISMELFGKAFRQTASKKPEEMAGSCLSISRRSGA